MKISFWTWTDIFAWNCYHCCSVGSMLKPSCVVDKWYNEEKDWEERNEMKSWIMWIGDGELDILALAGGERNFWVQRNFHQLRNIVYNCYLCVSLPIKHRNRNSRGILCGSEYSFHSPPRSRQNSPLIQFAAPQYFTATMISPPKHILPTHKKL